MGRGYQNAPGRVDLETEDRRRIQVGKEDERIVALVVLLEILEQRWAPGALLFEPLLLVGRCIVVIEVPVSLLVV